jgi:hypothetical protein
LYTVWEVGRNGLVFGTETFFFKLSGTERFKYKTRYFTDSGIIGSREFVRKTYQHFKDFFQSSNDRRPNRVPGLDDLYSLKRLHR